MTTQFGERLAERTDARRRRTRLRRALVAAVAVVAVAVTYLLLWSPVLALAEGDVRIEGTADVVDPGAVARLVDAETGVPLARIRTGHLEAAIERLRGVKDVEVTRAWPTGLAVAIVPRVPVAAVPVEGGYTVLDADGVEVMRGPAVPPGLPVVGIEIDPTTERALDAVLTVLGGLPPGLLGEVTAAGAESADAVRLVLSDRSTVVWGSAESSALKLRVLEVLRQRPASVYDVSAPTMPVTR